jgi:hypothetical protein
VDRLTTPRPSEEYNEFLSLTLQYNIVKTSPIFFEDLGSVREIDRSVVKTGRDFI